MRRIHPILSPLGIGLTILILIGMVVSFVKDGSAMFSPGELTSQNQSDNALKGFSSHAEFEHECQYCHLPLETNQADLCFHCHTDVMKEILTETGTHTQINNVQACRNCHPDHRGRDFDPTAAAFEYYDHENTSFSLIWHQIDYDADPLECIDCHAREKGFEFLKDVCKDCHIRNDPPYLNQHVQDFGDVCLACHDGLDRMTNFDHNTTALTLEGEHKEIACADCHLQGRFTNTPAACIDCHPEPEIHASLFSKDCAACHTSIDWSFLVGSNSGPFEHFPQTGFSLDRHRMDYAGEVLVCADCHASPDGFSLSTQMDDCRECHRRKAEAFMIEHQAQFGADCLVCHDGVDRMHDFDHDRVFRLEGGHSDLSCESCHLDQVFLGTPDECSECHQEPEIHAGYFGLLCENCHSTVAWSPAQLTAHSFPLDHGEQTLLACDVCHVEKYTEYTCYECHEHQPAEIIEEHLDEGISPVEIEHCVDCHPTGLEDETD